MNKDLKMIATLAVIISIVAIGAYVIFEDLFEKQVLKISTTTSLEDTGLLEILEAEFEKENPNIDVQFIAVGTGQAMEYGKKGDVDLIMVHSKSQEEQFIKEGYGTNRTPFAYNYFYILGPPSDPANINGTNATTAFKNILTAGNANPTQVKFVSRGDNSGTNVREIQIWNKTTNYTYNTSIREQPWYIESGKGMGDTLTLTNQLSAYTLSDSGTYLAYKGHISSVALVTQGKDLLNVYSIILINSSKFPHVNSAAAAKWLNFVTSKKGQDIITEYGKIKYSMPLFIPLAGEPEPTN